MENRPYGLWESPIQQHHLTQAVSLPDVGWDGNRLLWLENRGSESVIVCRDHDGRCRDLTAGFNVHAQVNYGGGTFAVRDGTLYFVDRSGPLLSLALDGDEAARPLTKKPAFCAAPAVSRNGRWVVYVRREGNADTLAIASTAGERPSHTLAKGADFYLHPVLHPDDRYVAWVEWDHPSMPWDGTRLMIAEFQNGAGQPSLVGTKRLAGGSEEAVVQPQFSPNGRLLAYLSDANGWSDLYLYDLGTGAHTCIVSGESEIADPAWIHGQRNYAFSADGQSLYYTESRLGSQQLCCVDIASAVSSSVTEFAAFTDVKQIAVNKTGAIAAVVGSSTCPSQVAVVDGEILATAARSLPESLPTKALAVPEAVNWRASDGQWVHGLYYPPSSATFCAEGPPPLLVHIHGGPTGQAVAVFEDELQFFATRGYAVLSVNYRGSTGYGRAYRQCLHGHWGVYDVEDAVAGACALIAEGRADADRMAIMGGSAGGYTALRALTCHPGLFRACLSRYGISDLIALARETHKFELHYLDSMLGSLPESTDLYRKRSPLYTADAITDPVAIFQGTVDEIVPRTQSDAIVESLRKRNIPCEYHVYEGEGHGFRNSATIHHYIAAAEAFLRKHLVNRE